MDRSYHILNGDCLKAQFPREIKGELIVIRECLVDGDVGAENLEELFQARAQFIESIHEESSAEDYYLNVASEFEKIRNLPAEATVCLWFEDDLFCQVNLWFVAHLLHRFATNCHAYLVRPKLHTQYGFGGLSHAELIQAYEDKIELRELDAFAKLWESYKNGDLDKLLKIAGILKERFPFVSEAVRAHIERIPSENGLGRQVDTLLEIIRDLRTREFGPVFREFNKRESIYGFGDLQVQRLLDKINDMDLY